MQTLLIVVGINAIYVFPAATLAICYTITCRTLWSGNQKLNEGCPEKTKRVLASRRSVVKMLIICVLVFYCCYIPWSIYQLFW